MRSLYVIKEAKEQGLHVENNLQLLTAEENSRKRNKFEMEVCY